jgi:hypothetical protein
MRNFLSKIAAPLLLLVLLAACAVQSQGGMVDRKLAEADPAKMGMIVGSFGKYVADKNFPSQSLLLRQLSSKSEDVTVTFAGNMDDFPPDFSDGKTHATIFAIKLPEGWYEIYNFRLLQPGVYGSSTTWSARGNFSFLFQIEVGKATYVGEYLSRVVTGRNFLGISTTGGAYFEVDDKRERDLAFAQKKWPDFNFGTVNDFIPDVAAMKNPLFVRAGAAN